MKDSQEKIFDLCALEEEFSQRMNEKAETDIDIRRGELQVKQINAIVNLERCKLDFKKLQIEEHRLMMEERRLYLDEMNTKFSIADQLSRKANKIQRVIGKTMVGLFPKQDKQVLAILRASQNFMTVSEAE